MAKGSNAPLIIKKVKKSKAEAHHGGAWKVDYADFVTAMMSFFLLLWLLNVTTDIQKRGIADYFEPTIASKSQSGAGGVLGGLTMGQQGAQDVTASAPNLQLAVAALVVGLADRDPLVPDDPRAPRNRRISIVLLRESKPAVPPSQAQAPL